MRLTRRLLRWWERKTGIDRVEFFSYVLIATFWTLLGILLLG